MPVLGMGGLFFRARDPDALKAWYKEHLGIGGGCRQSILEAAHLAGVDVVVIAANGDGSEIRTFRISELIPLGFGPANLADAEGGAPA